jgi:hypothetical protein
MRPQRCPVSSQYASAHESYYGQGDEHDADEALLISAGFDIHKPTPFEWQLEDKSTGLHVRYFPRSRRFICHGKSWRSSLKAVIRAVKDGRIRPDPGVKKSTCKLCKSAQIYWTKSANDKWLAVEFDTGAVHFDRCSGQKS